jgi:hypothetical protein
MGGRGARQAPAAASKRARRPGPRPARARSRCRAAGPRPRCGRACAAPPGRSPAPAAARPAAAMRRLRPHRAPIRLPPGPPRRPVHATAAWPVPGPGGGRVRRSRRRTPAKCSFSSSGTRKVVNRTTATDQGEKSAAGTARRNGPYRSLERRRRPVGPRLQNSWRRPQTDRRGGEPAARWLTAHGPPPDLRQARRRHASSATPWATVPRPGP